MGGRRWN
jgi:predicted ATPase